MLECGEYVKKAVRVDDRQGPATEDEFVQSAVQLRADIGMTKVTGEGLNERARAVLL